MQLTHMGKQKHDRLRRVSALSLLMMLLAPLCLGFGFSTSASEASLPSCCRTHGEHKCFTQMADPLKTSAGSGQSSISHIS
jgi:hypothetical protein